MTLLVPVLGLWPEFHISFLYSIYFEKKFSYKLNVKNPLGLKLFQKTFCKNYSSYAGSDNHKGESSIDKDVLYVPLLL